MVPSDFNSPSASTVAKKNMYADLACSFSVHPEKKDIRPLTDLDAVTQSVKNLVMTNFFERPFHPGIGSNLSAHLFKNTTTFTAISIRDAIIDTLTRFETRISNVNVQIFDDSDRNRYRVTVSYIIRFNRQPVTTELYLQRTR